MDSLATKTWSSECTYTSHNKPLTWPEISHSLVRQQRLRLLLPTETSSSRTL